MIKKIDKERVGAIYGALVGKLFSLIPKVFEEQHFVFFVEKMYFFCIE